MFRWIPFPMVRITAFFIAGILAALWDPDVFSEYSASVILVVLFLGYFLAVVWLKGSSALSILSGLIGLTAISTIGYLTLLTHTDSRNPSHISHVKAPIDFYLADVVGAPEEKINSVRFEIAINQIHHDQVWEEVGGKCLLYVSGKSGSPYLRSLQYGDRILIAGAPREVSPPGNPGEFDSKRFLSFRNISHQHVISANQIRVIIHATRHGLLFYSHQVRMWASEEIQHYVSGSQNQVIARALVLGVTEGIDDDLQGAYAASGAMHILSVSGLHVGVIYGMILFLLSPLRHHSWSRWLIALLSLVCLWAYAFVTGLSPSVLRAVTMFSFIAIAKPFARDTNIYNTLAASAFLLLLYDPFLIMSVGFQLSYLAVVGIVYLQRPLYLLWEPNSWFWDKVWQVTVVSLAAQLATFTLGLFYFHQFPVYFLFSNLLVIPLSVIVLVMGVVLLVASPLPWVAGFVGLILQFTISLLNGIVFFIEQLPFSLISGVHISAIQCGLMVVMIVCVIRLFETRRFHYLVGTFLLLIAFTTIQWQKVLAEQDHDQLVVYRVPGHGALEWINGNQSYFYSDQGLAGDERQLRFHIRPNHILSGVNDHSTHGPDPHFFKSFSGFRFFVLGKTTVLWVDRFQNALPNNAVADYLIIGNDAVRSLERLPDKMRYGTLILDSSNSNRYAERIVKEAESRKIPVHSIVSQGAYVVNL